tara:strand:+ start:509 stop:769 length:261 start_codon:yes stop_codon:yes gene_type:complete
MNLKNEMRRKYGSQVKASELEILFGIELLEIHKIIAQSKGEKFDSDKVVDFAVPTDEVADLVIGKEREVSSQSNEKTLVGALQTSD